MARSVKFEVFGQEYTLYTEAPEEDVQEILQLVRTHLQETCRATNVLPSSKSVILASLNMAGKYVKLRRDFEAFRKDVAAETERLRTKVEDFA